MSGSESYKHVTNNHEAGFMGTRRVEAAPKMPARQALDWGLAEEVAPSGAALDAALELARAACAMPPVIMSMSKQAIYATANANLHVNSFTDADVAMLVFDADEAVNAREEFRGGKS